MSLLVLMHLILLATSLPVEEENRFSRIAVHVREVEVKEPRHRTIRQAGMPRQKKFSFDFNSQKVELDLELNGFIRDAVNMYVTEKNITRLVERNKNNQEQYGYYQDRKTKASVMVKCKTVKCTPVGTFSINGARFRLDSNDNLAESTHFVTEVRLRPEDANIKGDTKTRFEYINPKNGRALINGTSIAGSSTSGKNGNSKGNSGSRVRRGIPAGVDIVELYIYTDEAVMNRFLNMYTDLNTALEMTRQYYSLICNEMDLEYQQVKDGNSAGIDIRLYLKGIHVALDSIGAPWSSNTQDSLGNVDYSKALEQFSVWQRDFKHAKNLSYDHAMAMSGKPFNADVVGIAWVGTVCDTDDVYLASLTSDKGLYLTFTAVHELGHFLSASHDPTNGSCSLGYIMGSFLYTADETTAGNQHTFSSCSINDFTNKLNSLGVNRCTRQHSFTDQEYTAYRSEPTGGEQLSLDQQCQVYFGAGSYACSKGVDMCYRGINCQTSTGCDGSLYVVFDHSPCQEPSNKWCSRGLCVEKPAKPTTTQGQTTTTARPPTTTGRPPTTTGRAPTTTGRPPTTTGRPQTTTGRPPTTTGRPQTTTGRAPTTTGRPPTTTGRPPITTSRPKTTQKPTTTRCTVFVTCTRVGRKFIGAGCCTRLIKANCCTNSMTSPTCSVKRRC